MFVVEGLMGEREGVGVRLSTKGFATFTSLDKSTETIYTTTSQSLKDIVIELTKCSLTSELTNVTACSGCRYCVTTYLRLVSSA